MKLCIRYNLSSYCNVLSIFLGPPHEHNTCGHIYENRYAHTHEFLSKLIQNYKKKLQDEIIIWTPRVQNTYMLKWHFWDNVTGVKYID